MPSQETIAIIKSTVPVLQEHGGTITKVFYEELFKAHPALKGIFNMTNQKKGEQPKALAETIFKYAVHIDKLELLGDTVELIAHKHASFSVTEDMYPIVGSHLLGAIKIVLGDAATPEIINAWAEAYESLAVIFVKREEQLYSEKETTKGGFRGMKEFTVDKKVAENEFVTSFYLKRKDNSPIPQFKPGQYIATTIDIPNTEHKHSRNYSLSCAPNNDHLRISVKKEAETPKGVVSNYLHKNLSVGSSLQLGMPSGNFILKDSKKPLVLISGGIGITPLMSMYLSATTANNRPIQFIQCFKNSSVQTFKKEIASNSNELTSLTTIYSAPLQNDQLNNNHDYKGYLTLDIIKDLKVDTASEFYVCGPEAFISNTISILKTLNVSKEHINFELFGPKLSSVLN